MSGLTTRITFHILFCQLFTVFRILINHYVIFSLKEIIFAKKLCAQQQRKMRVGEQTDLCEKATSYLRFYVIYLTLARGKDEKLQTK